MAEDEGKFSHIVMTDDEDDEEVVIYTGRRAAQSSPAPVEEEPLDDEKGEDVLDEQPEPEPPTPAPEPAEEAPKKKKKEKYVYRETTAEDLEDTSMSTAQKVIIAFCVVFLVGFIIYYSMNY